MASRSLYRRSKTVERIFREYLSGRSLEQIQEGLVADDMPAASGISVWSRQAIRNPGQ